MCILWKYRILTIGYKNLVSYMYTIHVILYTWNVGKHIESVLLINTKSQWGILQTDILYICLYCRELYHEQLYSRLKNIIHTIHRAIVLYSDSDSGWGMKHLNECCDEIVLSNGSGLFLTRTYSLVVHR